MCIVEFVVDLLLCMKIQKCGTENSVISIRFVKFH